MDVLARANVPFYPPDQNEELIPKRYVDDLFGELPIVSRVRIKTANSAGSGSNTGLASHTVYLEMDRPAPADCFVQFWRYRGAYRIGHGRYSVTGFRALGHDSPTQQGASSGFATVTVPQGVREIACGTVAQMFRPVRISRFLRGSGIYPYSYSRYYREVTPAQWDNEMPAWMRTQASSRGRRDTKVILKFGLIRRYREPGTNYWIEKKGPMSVETVKIMRWRYSYSGWIVGSWGYRIDVT